MHAIDQGGLMVDVGATGSGKLTMLNQPEFADSLRAAKRLRGFERYGSRKAKVLAHRHRGLPVTTALAAVAKGLSA